MGMGCGFFPICCVSSRGCQPSVQDVPDWELECSFNPVRASLSINRTVRWASLGGAGGKDPQPMPRVTSFEEVLAHGEHYAAVNENSVPPLVRARHDFDAEVKARPEVQIYFSPSIFWRTGF